MYFMFAFLGFVLCNEDFVKSKCVISSFCFIVTFCCNFGRAEENRSLYKGSLHRGSTVFA